MVMGQTIISPVSVTHPASATETVALTTARYVKVSDRSTLSLSHHFCLISVSSVFACCLPSWSQVL